ncbi:MAG: TlpA family protein disulfide reductase [Proteobacteria bacterium]|nr:TlpA family protein disulfide reductase [Pseudomonadota bacterium]
MSFWKKKDNLIITGFVVAFFIGLSVWFDLCCVRAAFFPTKAAGSAFEVTFFDQNQNPVTLDQFKGKPLIVNIWATWCPVCVKKMASLNRFAGTFHAKGGQVLTISQDQGGAATVRAYYARNGYNNLPIYLDSSGQLLSAFGARGLPTSVFIDAQGKEVGRIEGGIDWDSSEVSNMIGQYFGINFSQ